MEEGNNPCVLGEYDKDAGFEKGVIVVHDDGTMTLTSFQGECSTVKREKQRRTYVRLKVV